MAKGKSTWRYNKLLTARRNYYDVGGTLNDWKTNNTIGTNFTPEWFNSLDMPGKMDVISWLNSNYLNQYLPNNIKASLGSDWLTELDFNDGMLVNPYGGIDLIDPESEYIARSNYITGRSPIEDGPVNKVDTTPANIAGGIVTSASVLATQVGGTINDINASDVKTRRNQYFASVNNSQLKGIKNDSWDRLMHDYSTTSSINSVNEKDMGAKNVAQIAGEGFIEGLKGSAAGFSTSSSFGAYGGPLNKGHKYMGGGPIGAIIGGVVGAGTSLIGNLIRNDKARKAAREVNAQIDYTKAFNQRSLVNRADNLIAGQMAGLESNYRAFGGPVDGAMDYEFMTDYLNTKRMVAEGRNNTITSLPNSFAEGGNVGTVQTHGGDFPMPGNFLSINEGGSHESNPLEGVPMGIAPDGTPNLVEEGETVFNDYVFSKRLMVPRKFRRKYKLGKELSFAEASKKLAKESEERPNDPISQKGLEALMSDLAGTQETIKEEQQNSEFALGGNLAGNKKAGGGWNFNNNSNDAAMAGSELFSPFFNNNAFDFAAMHADNSTYRQRLDRVAGILWKRKQNPDYKYTDDEKKILEGYRNNIRSWNNGKGYDGGIDELSYDRIIGDSLTTNDGVNFTLNTKPTKVGLALDSKRGGHYWGAAGVNPYELVEEHMLMGKDGSLTKLPEEQRYWEGRRKSDSKNWGDMYGKTLKREDEGRYTTYFDKENNKEIRRYLYSPIEEAKDNKDKKHYVRIQNSDGTYGDAILFDEAKQKGLLKDYIAGATGKEGDDDLTYYDPLDKNGSGKYNDWLRYAPAVGLGIGTITDAMGITNKPDYSNADAILDATRTAGIYQPVKFNPIGNYLAYKPFDRDFYINKQNAEAGAARSSLLNTAAGNRATAMAGLLAADNNYINGIGTLARQAEEYNLAQRQQVEDFNRGTNITNSQGMLQADTANQKALSDMRELSLKGVMAAADMREKARLNSDASRSANLSGLFQTLGDIGFEEKNRRMVDWSILHGVYGPGTEDYGRITTNYGTGNRNGRSAAKGGKIKRKKRGLTV